MLQKRVKDQDIACLLYTSEHCARAVCMKKKNIFQLSEKNRTSTAKYAPLLERLCQREGADALSLSLIHI